MIRDCSLLSVQTVQAVIYFLSVAEDLLIKLPKGCQILKVFFMCVPNWTQDCSHIIGYIPVPICLLFAIAPTHDWNGYGAAQTCTWAIFESTAHLEQQFTSEILKFYVTFNIIMLKYFIFLVGST